MLGVIDQLNRQQKQLTLLALDGVVFAASLWLAFVFRLGTIVPDTKGNFWWFLGAIVAVRVPIFIRTGMYRAVLRQSGGELTRICLLGTGLSVAVLGAILFFFGPDNLPRSVVLIEACLSAVLVIAGREYSAGWLRARARNGSTPTLIYGAGSAGAQLVQAFQQGGAYLPRAFVDDDPSKWGLQIGGLKVYSPDQIPRLVQKFKIQQALLATPSATGQQRGRIAQGLEAHGLKVLEVPNFLKLVKGLSSLHDLSEVRSSELLNRGTVSPDSQLFWKVIPGKSVMITGAGGSIGSEICRQVAALGPSRLILFERCEYALYKIEMELADRFPDLSVAAVLGSVLDANRVKATISRFGVQSVYHAAAYKHVPLVEQNPIVGVHNNVFGTLTVAKAAKEAGVQTFLLVSTDKAVRPKNVMGASKRLAELACLMLSDEQELQASSNGKERTRFLMVRFGNVLDSAGSVVPRFRSQIAKGGPVTVTDPDVTRYFMTIPEAAQLVIQASALGAGGEVFLLDMGDPVKVNELAKRMIELATRGTGREIRIEYTGLRPGEKLVEELLVNNANSQPTAHSKVFKAVESGPSAAVISAHLVRLEKACERSDLNAVYQVLATLVEGYVPPEFEEDVLARKDAQFSFHRAEVKVRRREQATGEKELAPEPESDPARVE